MKNLIIIASMAVSLSAAAALPTPVSSKSFTCVPSDSKSSQKLKSVIFDQEHDFDVEERMSYIIKSAGYDWLSVDNIINCSNENSEGVDFELLRKYTINSIIGRRLL